MSESEKVNEQLILFPYKRLLYHDKFMTILIKDGKVIPPVKITRYYVYYRKKDYDEADIVLTVKLDVSGRGVFHDCEVYVKNPRPESLDKLVEIHNCPQTLYIRRIYKVM